MDLIASLLVQTINGIASASALYLVAVGLAIIFGVTRIVNFAHGAFFMLGLYIAIHTQQTLDQYLNTWLDQTVNTAWRAFAYWGNVATATVVVAGIAAFLERTVLRRLYALPELFQLLATFAWVLIAQDAALYIWGAEEILGSRAPGLSGAITFAGRAIPQYDVLLVVLAPLLGYALHLVLQRTTLGLHIRAASEDRIMAQALGVRQGALMCATFALGCGLAALGGALQMPREPASTGLALSIVGDAFVVVVIGGMGSLGGAYIAALMIGILKAVCVWLGTVELLGYLVPFPKLTQVLEFLLMAIVLSIKPQGLFGRVETLATAVRAQEYSPLKALPTLVKWLTIGGLLFICSVIALVSPDYYMLTLGIDMCIAMLFAISLNMLLSPAGIPSFGHAALFGLGAYATGFIMPGYGMTLGLIAACITAASGGIISALITAKMTGVYRAMLTLALAQLLWSASYQWDAVTGGSNGLTGLWPPAPFDTPKPMLWISLGLCIIVGLLSINILNTRLGLHIRALRDSPQRATSLGLNALRLRTLSFMLSGCVAGLSGGLYVCAKGTVAPDVLSIHQSVNGLVMVLMGGINSLTGAITGALSWTMLSDVVLRQVPYWRACLGCIIVCMVIFLPKGISGWLESKQKGGRYV